MHVIEIPLSGLSSLLESAGPEPVAPHPDLVASITPSAADIMHVAFARGWYADPPFFRPAVPMRQED